jgi:hypothetical protein
VLGHDDHPAFLGELGVVGLDDERPDGAIVVNETGLDDLEVVQAVQEMFVEHASLAGVNPTNFQVYAGSQEGSLLARREWSPPTNVFEEVELARDLAERDDDVAATLGQILATAYAGGMEHHHEDEKTIALFNEVAKHMGEDMVLREMLREYLIASSVTTLTIFTRESFRFSPEGVDRMVNQDVSAPLVGVLPAEEIRVVDNDLFHSGTLAWKPKSGKVQAWLRDLFSDKTTAAKKLALRKQDPVYAAMVLGPVKVESDRANALYDQEDAWLLNPRMVHRTAAPKGTWKYPRPRLTRNFALLEAKRLLNILDYALLQGGSNFIVVAKKGTDQHKATPNEIRNLGNVVQKASRTGVIVGDHRLSIEIITPNLTELLNAEKRTLIGRKLAMGLLNVPEHGVPNPAGEGQKAELEFIANTVTVDRGDMRRHMENSIYREIERRNPRAFPKGAASIWHAKIVLQGLQVFTDMILKLRDRGDIPRRYGVEAAGFDYDAAVQQRKREKARGDDKVLTTPPVPFNKAGGPANPASQPNPPGGPADTGGGRPRGTGPNNGAAGARASETVTAWWDEDEQAVLRVGDVTYAVLEEYEETRTVGRLSANERRALQGETAPGIVALHVNSEYAVQDDALSAVRLTPERRVTLVTGRRDGDEALVTKAILFRDMSPTEAEELALRWGFEPESFADGEQEEHAGHEDAPAGPPPLHIIIDTAGGKVKRTIVRDDDGNIVGSTEEPLVEVE